MGFAVCLSTPSILFHLGAEETIDNIAIPAAEAGEFTKDYDLTTRNTAGTEKYTFTVTNRDGLITTRAITITVP